MAEGKIPNAIEGKARAGISAQEKEEMRTAAKFADDHGKEVKKLINKIQEMWQIQLLWDAKISKIHKKLYYFFSLTASNRDDVVTEINNYLTFYEEMSTAVSKIYEDSGKSETEQANPQEIIATLRQKLEKMLREAKSGENFTTSSTAYDLHKEFIASHEKLESMIKNVEIVSLKQGVMTANDRWEKSLQKIDELKKKLEDYQEKTDHLCDRIDVLILQNEGQSAQIELLLEERQKREDQLNRTEKQNEILLEYVRQELENRKQAREEGGN